MTLSVHICAHCLRARAQRLRHGARDLPAQVRRRRVPLRCAGRAQSRIAHLVPSARAPRARRDQSAQLPQLWCRVLRATAAIRSDCAARHWRRRCSGARHINRDSAGGNHRAPQDHHRLLRPRAGAAQPRGAARDLSTSARSLHPYSC